MSDILSRVHMTKEEVASIEMTPPHAPRVETEAYRKSHHYLVVTQDKPCQICGVRQSTLADPARNPFGAKAMETHHYPIERSLVDACDPTKVHQAYPEVIDEPTLLAFVDSPRNLVVLCDVHHRSLRLGIHHLLTQDFVILPFLYDHYQISATPADAASIERSDDQIEASHGMEQHATTNESPVPPVSE